MYSSYFGLPSEPNIRNSIISAKPRIAFSVRELMAHVGQELRLGQIGGFRPSACLPESLFDQLQRGYVSTNANQATFAGGTNTDSDPASRGNISRRAKFLGRQRAGRE